MSELSQNGPADLSVELGGLLLANPVMTASGTCGYGLELAPYLDLSRLGAFTTKSITRLERRGNDPPRVAEVRHGLLNAIGLANIGLERFMSEKVPDLPKLGCPIVVNVAGGGIDDYVAVCAALDPVEEISALELNVSCPNVADGLEFGTDPRRLAQLLGEVRPAVKRCVLIVKLSPNVTDIVAVARAAIAGGAEVLSMVNTFAGMSIDVETHRPRLANTSGGLSGPAIKPLAVHLVHQVYRQVARQAGVPIIGMGGIETWQDAVEFLLAGASAVAVGTALFVNPGAPVEIIEGMQAYLQRRGLGSVRDLVGRVQL
jgi:dihydroorotate dehydrogenase (NAD+) catalytic subunit